jgi:hypothetical protein
MDNLLIRNAQFQEMPNLISLAAKEGWNPGLNDAEFYFKADSSGFIIALLNEQLAGCISAISYSESFAFIGFHLIAEEFRNRGFENYLLQVVLQKFGGINIGLNSVEHNVEYYESFGFKPAHKILRYEGIVNGNYEPCENIISPFIKKYDLLYDYEKKFFPADRKLFMYQWMNQPGSMLLAKFADNEYKGFGLFLPCLTGYKIAPLICDDLSTAEKVISNLLYNLQKDTRFYLDVPENNENALILAEKLNMKLITKTVRMYSQTVPAIGIKNIYGFTSFELG